MNANDAKLQIVEGAYYRNRKGEKIGPMKKYAGSKSHPWCTEDGNWIFRDDGNCYSNTFVDADLIATWADPAAEAAGVEPGEGWRYLDVADDKLRGDDETRSPDGTWKAVEEHCGWCIGQTCHVANQFRRRITAPKSVTSVDLWQHEREEYQRAIDALQERCNWLEKDGHDWECFCKEYKAERDELQKLVNSKDGHNYYRLWGESCQEVAELKRANAEKEKQRQCAWDTVRERTTERDEARKANKQWSVRLREDTDELRQQLAEARDRTKMDAAEIGELNLRVKELGAELAKATPAVQEGI